MTLDSHFQILRAPGACRENRVIAFRAAPLGSMDRGRFSQLVTDHAPRHSPPPDSRGTAPGWCSTPEFCSFTGSSDFLSPPPAAA